ncbi:MAG: hypothetical protein J5772_08455 [Clostridia bacterium]|nr:hypothetical protein [Clostridia bacterium]
MKNQFVKLSAWMNGLGLTPVELIAFAVICSYTEYKGGYDGRMEWLAEWTGADAAAAEKAVRSLEEKGLVIKRRSRFGEDMYRSCVLEGAYARERARSIDYISIDSMSADNTIDKMSIDSMSTDSMSTDKTIDKMSIDSMSADKTTDKMSIDSMSIDPSDDLNAEAVFKDAAEKPSADDMPADGRGSFYRSPADKKTGSPKKGRALTPKDVEEIIAPYQNVADVPLEELERRIAAWNARHSENGASADTDRPLSLSR